MDTRKIIWLDDEQIARVLRGMLYYAADTQTEADATARGWYKETLQANVDKAIEIMRIIESQTGITVDYLNKPI